MTRFGNVMLCALLVLPATAMARDRGGAGGGFLDLMYIPKAEIEISDSSGSTTIDDGAGFGVRGRIVLEGGLFLQGEYQTNDYDRIGDSSGSVDFKSESMMLRAGIGIAAGESPVYGLVEFIKQELEFTDACGIFDPCSFDDTGYGLHVGLRGGGEGASAYAQIGMVDVGDFGNGIEFLLGAVLNINPTSGVFAEYRNTTEEDDSGAEGEIADIRVGLRVGFGG